ncbi:MAG: lysophospholipid acyltransferase family protein [Spirochaetaceae bacterium]
MRRAVVDTVIAVLLKLLVRVRAVGVDRVPRTGPLILAINHINFLEIPLLYTLLRPRRVLGMAKAETWHNPALRILANLWEAIPLHRGVADTRAFNRAAEELRRGGIVGVAPEGTRSRHGRLQRANAGIVTLAARTGAPILPVAHYGGEEVFRSFRHFRRARVTVRVGKPIVVAQTDGLTRAQREHYLTEVMTALARLLPPEYRGYYADCVGP